MENGQVETMKAPQPPTAEQGPRTSDPKRELLSGTGLFIGMGLLGFWFGVGATLSSKMVTVWKNLYA